MRNRSTWVAPRADAPRPMDEGVFCIFLRQKERFANAGHELDQGQ